MSATMTGSLPVNEWIDQVIASLSRMVRSPHNDILPAFPDAVLQANTTSLSGEAAVRQAGAFYQDVVGALESQGEALQAGQKVLDFGCGWGRIGRMFLRDTTADCIHGLDVDPEFVAICRELFSTESFDVCPAHPPSHKHSGTYDLVVAYSVFSHLSETAARGWLLEFSRLLKPGGFVAFTTRHASFFDYVDWARTAQDVDPYTRELGRLFETTSVPRAALAAGEFVHATSRGVSGGGVRNESFYGETWIPESYLVREFDGIYSHVGTYFNPERYDQVSYVLRKRG